MKLNPLRRRCSGVPHSLRTPLPLSPPFRGTSLRLRRWFSPQCQRHWVWIVWIVMQRWPSITSAKTFWPRTVKATGKTSRVNKICIQHLIWKVMIGLTSLRTVFEDFMVNTVEMCWSPPIVNNLELNRFCDSCWPGFALLRATLKTSPNLLSLAPWVLYSRV